ncbi:MAG: FAD-dependent oxidoreductase, partial [Phycisphaerales bacterium]|nr:FAD-dependent oxidoreductase [Phycisphaerales bacterium]
METHAFDLVVVGHGIAGLAAAVSAMQQGAKVAVLERAPADESGGCTRYTEAYLRLKSEDELSDDFESVMADAGSANPDPDLVHSMTRPPNEWPGILRTMSVTDPEFIATFARETIPTIKWLKTFGIRFIPGRLPHITAREHPSLVMPSGGGHAMLEALVNAGRNGGVKFFYETTARRLIQDETDAVVGVQAVGRQNRRVAFSAGAVVLASGGFEGNPEMLRRYVGLGSINILGAVDRLATLHRVPVDPGVPKHIYQRIDAEFVDLAFEKVTQSRLSHPHTRRAFLLGKSTGTDKVLDLAHQFRAQMKVLRLVRCKPNVQQYVSASTYYLQLFDHYNFLS